MRNSSGEEVEVEVVEEVDKEVVGDDDVDEGCGWPLLFLFVVAAV